MRFIPALLAAAWCLTASAGAQPQQRPVKPYARVTITPAAASSDTSFASFRDAIAAAAKARIYAGLAQFVVTQGFFWDRDYDRAFDPRKSAVDNLAGALALEHHNGSGWARLAALATEAAVEPMASRPGVVCAPARPGFDAATFAKLLDTTYTTGIDWAYPRASETPVHAMPQPQAAVVGKLGLYFVQLLGFVGDDDDPARTAWARVALPDGGTGFVAPAALLSLTTARLCYTKDLIAGWRISGYVAGGQ